MDTDPVLNDIFDRDAKDKFFKCVLSMQAGECWIWDGVVTSAGYGACRIKGDALAAHRMSYTMFYGPIPEDMIICHKCDVRRCVNPKHLYLGTHSDNVKDAWERSEGMTNCIRRYSQFNSADKDVMIYLRNQGMFYNDIGTIFNVTGRTINDIISNKTVNLRRTNNDY